MNDLSQNTESSIFNMLDDIVRISDEWKIHGLLFQHILLCPTRAWLHYHRVDCAHLNRYMQLGLLLHEHSADNSLSQGLYGISPDRVDWKKREVSEIKKSRSHEEALINQLLFYLAVLTKSTGQVWRGVLRYTASRRTKTILLDTAAIAQLQDSLNKLRHVLFLPNPPQKEEKNVCKGCSYRILCWGLSTEDEDA